MPTLDEAISFLVDYVRSPRSSDYSSFGYDIYLPNVMHYYLMEILEENSPGPLIGGSKAEAISPAFYEAAWELSRRGILRPGVRYSGEQIVESGSGGAGFSITSNGRPWFENAHEHLFVPREPGRFAQMTAPFGEKFGDGYMQRAQEAARCNFSNAYLASCAMSGAAAESILLKLAITKDGDEKAVLRRYRRARGRSRVENIVVGQLREPLAGQFRGLMDLLKYWRDEAAHGSASEISDLEAEEALMRLLRLSHFAQDHWDELTAQRIS